MAEPDITALLRALSAGESDALDRVMPLVYEELRRVARAHLRRERDGHTFDSAGLIHETWLRLIEIRQVEWRDRHHFVAVAARMMRRVLTDYARARRRLKRGGQPDFVSLGGAIDVPTSQADDFIELDEMLERLEALNARACRVVECRCFGGLSVEETAAVLRTSPATVKRDWVFSRAWLNRELRRHTA